jgi:hypothetical protein
MFDDTARERLHLNRDRELAAINDLVRISDNPVRVAIVCGDKGWGKTALLDEVYYRHNKLTATVYADLGGQYHPLLLLDFLADQFQGRGVDFTKYFAARDSNVAGSQTIFQLERVRAKQSPITVNAPAQEWDVVISGLLRHFLDAFDEISAPTRRLVLLDGYDRIQGSLRNWLIDQFVGRLVSRNTVACVISGSIRPVIPGLIGENIRWLSLGPLRPIDVGDWIEAVVPGVGEERAKFLWQGTSGIPGRIDEFLRVYAAAGDNHA